MDWQPLALGEDVRHQLFTPQEMARVDQHAGTVGSPIATLMEAAGFEVANLVAALHPFGVRVAVVAGLGNNGGDAFVAAEVLRARGYKVTVVDAAPDVQREGASGAARRAFGGATVSGEDGVAVIGAADVVVDGLLGGGLSRDVAGDFKEIVDAINRSGAAVIAIDLPSGICGATGAIRGVAVRAHRTITFEALKVGHVMEPGRRHAGRVSVAGIGMPSRAFEAVDVDALPTLNAPAAWGRGPWPTLGAAAHKYDRGHVVVLSGPMSATGAARLAATASLRAGAGLATVASAPDALLVNAAHLTTVMLQRIGGPEEFAALLSDRRHNGVVLGPGLPVCAETAEMARVALASGAHVVLDAGAIRALFRDSAAAPEALRAAHQPVLTPHSGEMRDILAALGIAPSADKLAQAKDVAERLGAVLVHKGADTVIAGRAQAAVNANAPPWLATAGTGDVLAGIIGGLLAQGFRPFDAARIGVWLHGDTAARAGRALIADDLLASLKNARADLDKRLTPASPASH